MMKTFGKLLAGLLALVFVLAIAGIVAFKFLADPERLKAEVIELVAQQTGRELTIDGDLELSFVPWLGFRVGAMSLSNEDGFGDTPFASLAAAEARVRLWPLFRKQIEVGKLGVDGLMLDLVAARDGRSNWSDFMPEGEQQPGPEKEGFRARGIDAISIENADIRYRDLASGDEYRLRQAALSAGPLTPGEPFEITAAFDIDIDNELSVSVAKSSTTLTTDAEAGRLETGKLKAELVFSGTAVGPKPVPAQFNAEAAVLDSKAETITLKSIEMRTLDTEIRSTLTGSNIFERGVYVGPVSVANFSPRTVMQGLDIPVPETADSGVLRKASLEAAMRYSKDSLSLNNLKARVDDSMISGSFSMTSIKQQRMAFNLDIDAIDLDRYLPPAAKGKGTGAAAGDDAELPADLLRKLNLDGTVRIGKLKAAGIQSSDVKATVKAANGNLRVNPSQAKLYGGQYSGDVRLSALPNAVALSLDETVSGIQAGAMLAEVFDTRRLSGSADVKLRLSGSGKTMAGIRKSLSGDMSYQFTDGYLEGIDVWYEIQRAKAVFGKAEMPVPSKPARTRYSDMRGTAVVKDGVMRNEDFVATLPFLNLAGRGDINLAEATMDYRVNATVLKKPEVEADALTADLIGGRIPLRINGDLASPSVSVDVATWARNKAKEKIEEKVLGKLFGKSGDKPAEEAAAGQEGEQPAEKKDPEEALKEELEDKLKNKLKGLLGGGGP